jgi:cytoskeletal protein RodZ
MSTVGEQLRQAREQQNLSFSEIAEISKIRKDYLEALETGNYDVFLAPVYIRGFIRTYARILKLNTDEIVEKLNRELGQSARDGNEDSSLPRKKGLLDIITLQLTRIPLPQAGIFLLIVVMVWVAILISNAEPNDPLKNLGAGQYQPAKKTIGEYLPIPTR